MDEIVRAALKKWPNVPACYGWLALDARGDWYMRDDRIQAAGPFPTVKGSRIEHDKLREFIQRNYACRRARLAGSSRTGRSASTSNSRPRPGSGGFDGDSRRVHDHCGDAGAAGFEWPGSTSTGGSFWRATSASASCTRRTCGAAQRDRSRPVAVTGTSIRRAAAALRLPPQPEGRRLTGERRTRTRRRRRPAPSSNRAGSPSISWRGAAPWCSGAGSRPRAVIAPAPSRHVGQLTELRRDGPAGPERNVGERVAGDLQSGRHRQVGAGVVLAERPAVGPRSYKVAIGVRRSHRRRSERAGAPAMYLERFCAALRSDDRSPTTGGGHQQPRRRAARRTASGKAAVVATTAPSGA